MVKKSQTTNDQPVPTKMVKTYTFRVAPRGNNTCWCKIEMKPDQTLEELHLAIQSAYEFDNDHLYSFFMSNKAWDTKTEYSLPEGVSPYGDMFDTFGEDQGEIEAIEEVEETEIDPFDLNVALDELSAKDPDKRKVYEEALDVLEKLKPKQWKTSVDEWSSKVGIDSDEFIFQITRLAMLKDLLQEIEHEMQSDVRTVTLESLKLRVNKKFLYLFDYGDEWRFQVQLIAINKAALDGDDFPRLVEFFGKPPSQYPGWESEDDDEFEDE